MHILSNHTKNCRPGEGRKDYCCKGYEYLNQRGISTSEADCILESCHLKSLDDFKRHMGGCNQLHPCSRERAIVELVQRLGVKGLVEYLKILGVSKPLVPRVLKTPVSQLEPLSKMMKEALEEAGIITTWDLLGHSTSELQRKLRLQKGNIDQLRYPLSKLGVSFYK